MKRHITAMLVISMLAGLSAVPLQANDTLIISPAPAATASWSLGIGEGGALELGFGVNADMRIDYAIFTLADGIPAPYTAAGIMADVMKMEPAMQAEAGSYVAPLMAGEAVSPSQSLVETLAADKILYAPALGIAYVGGDMTVAPELIAACAAAFGAEGIEVAAFDAAAVAADAAAYFALLEGDVEEESAVEDATDIADEIPKDAEAEVEEAETETEVEEETETASPFVVALYDGVPQELTAVVDIENARYALGLGDSNMAGYGLDTYLPAGDGVISDMTDGSLGDVAFDGLLKVGQQALDYSTSGSTSADAAATLAGITDEMLKDTRYVVVNTSGNDILHALRQLIPYLIPAAAEAAGSVSSIEELILMLATVPVSEALLPIVTQLAGEIVAANAANLNALIDDLQARAPGAVAVFTTIPNPIPAEAAALAGEGSAIALLAGLLETMNANLADIVAAQNLESKASMYAVVDVNALENAPAFQADGIHFDADTHAMIGAEIQDVLKDAYFENVQKRMMLLVKQTRLA